jgi:hypothetical protein
MNDSLAPSWLDVAAGLNKLELEIRQLNLFWVEFDHLQNQIERNSSRRKIRFQLRRLCHHNFDHF